MIEVIVGFGVVLQIQVQHADVVEHCRSELIVLCLVHALVLYKQTKIVKLEK